MVLRKGTVGVLEYRRQVFPVAGRDRVKLGRGKARGVFMVRKGACCFLRRYKCTSRLLFCVRFDRRVKVGRGGVHGVNTTCAQLQDLKSLTNAAGIERR